MWYVIRNRSSGEARILYSYRNDQSAAATRDCEILHRQAVELDINRRYCVVHESELPLFGLRNY